MRKFFYIADNTLSLLKRHKLIVFLLLLQCIICFCLTGIIANRLYTTNENIQNYENNILSKDYYKLTEHFDDGFYYAYMNDDHKFIEILNYLESIKEEFNYLIVTEQPIAIKKFEVPQECLNGYESGNYDNAISTDTNGMTIYSTKSLQVSSNFFDEFGIKAQTGSLWSESAFRYNKGTTIPIVLGASYSDVKIGEKINGVYLDEHITFEVVAILESNSSWTVGQSINYTDRYIIIPSFLVTEDETNSFSKMRLLQQICGIIIGKQDYDITSRTVKQIANANDLSYGATGVSLINHNQEIDVLETYSKMTATVKEQFVLLFITLILFVIFSLALTINGFIRSHHYEFGIRLLNGATIYDIILNVAIMLILIIGTSMFISIAILLITANFSIYVFILSTIITILSALFPIYHIIHLDISTIISGKE